MVIPTDPPEVTRCSCLKYYTQCEWPTCQQAFKLPPSEKVYKGPVTIWEIAVALAVLSFLIWVLR